MKFAFNFLNYGVDAIESLGLSPLIQLLNSFGRWPMTVTNWTEENFDWRKTSAYIRNSLGGNFLIDVSNYIDTNNTEKSTIYVICSMRIF